MGSYADTHARADLPPMKGRAPMPPMISALALGAGLTLAGLGLVVLLMRRTMHARATPPLIWGGRRWHLRPVALALGVASALCLMVPRADGSAGPPRTGKRRTPATALGRRLRWSPQAHGSLAPSTPPTRL
jgi:hypothetical protein